MRQILATSVSRALALALLLTVATAWGAGYENLVDQGLFYLSRGATYGPEAARSLEQAREADPDRAAGDPRLLGALARAYALTARYTEAFWLLEGMEGLGRLGTEDQALRERLLSESGLGRVRLVSAVPVPTLMARFEPAEGVRLDVAARKALERLAELLARGVRVGARGATLLAPEGRYRVSLQAEALQAPREPLELEVWAGDEVGVRLVARFPDPDRWKVEARSRSVALAWPELDGTSYRLHRLLDGAEQLVYEGDAPAFVDAGLPVGARAGYRLECVNAADEVVASSTAEAETLPPVSEVEGEAELGGDLRVRVRWSLGRGAADRVRVVREAAAGDVVLAEVSGPEALAEGQTQDGPFAPVPSGQELRYRVEAWVSGDGAPAAVGRVGVEVPPLVARVTDVAESIDRGAVVVVWDTVPRDAVAEGYAIFRQKGPEVEGELVGRAQDPFAREFEYAVENPLTASSWRHFVIPYVGDRYLLDPERFRVRGTEPEEGLDRRRRKGESLPDLGLSWDPYPGARLYAVTVGDREVLVKKPYVEASGLQNPLMATDQRVAVFAVDAKGERVLLLSLDLRYGHYPRAAREKEGEP